MARGKKRKAAQQVDDEESADSQQAEQSGQGEEAQRGNAISGAAQRVGFSNDRIPSQLYTVWRAQVHLGVQNWNCFRALESGTNRWGKFCEWAAGQLNSNDDDTIRGHVRLRCDNIAEKARVSRQSMWDTIH